MRITAVPMLLLAACTATVKARHAAVTKPDSLTARVDSVFADIRHDGPGCAVGAYRNGELLLAKVYGLANVEDGRRITPRSTFELGSVSKQFTALAVLTLEAQHRLSLDDKVRRYIPELPDYGVPIRIRDLLQHTSGLRDYGSLNILAGRETETMADFVALLASQERLNFPPGTRHEYSHSDFELLGLIVERAVQEPFGTYLEREVLRPLGMTGSRVYDGRGTRVPERAFGHAKSEDGFRVVFNKSELAGGGNLYISVDDLRHWDRALAEGASGSRPLVGRMLTRPTLPNGDTIAYAYGLRKGSYRGLATVSRGSHSNGTRTEIIRFPDQQFGIATLCNADHIWAGQRAERVADVFLGAVMQQRRPSYSPPAPVPISTTELQRYVGVYHSPGSLDFSRIAILNGKLVELFGDTAQTFTYRGDGLFTADGITGDFRLAFSRSPSGTMRLEYVSQGEVDVVWERLPDSAVWRPDSAALADYAGTYFSGELDTVWQLAVRDGDLVLRRPGRADGPLLPMRPDVFNRHFGLWNEPLVAGFEFSRDSTGRITHFTITTPPGADVVRGLRFVRAPAR